MELARALDASKGSLPQMFSLDGLQSCLSAPQDHLGEWQRGFFLRIRKEAFQDLFEYPRAQRFLIGGTRPDLFHVSPPLAAQLKDGFEYGELPKQAIQEMATVLGFQITPDAQNPALFACVGGLLVFNTGGVLLRGSNGFFSLDASLLWKGPFLAQTPMGKAA